MTIFRDNGDAISQAADHLASVTDDGGWCAYLLRPVTTLDEAWTLLGLPENDGVSIADFEYWPLWSVWGEDGTYS